MHRRLFLAAMTGSLLLGGCVSSGASIGANGGPAAGARLVAMTYNIRLDIASDGDDAWPNRKDLVAALIAHEQPDVLGLQEVLLHQRDELARALPDYRFIGAARDDGREAGEFSPLAIRASRFAVLDHGTFWLSPTPEVPGKAWDAAYPRIATWALLRDRASGQQLRVLNTHFDHVGAEARANSARLIAAWLGTGPQADLPAIVLGDFNADPQSEPLRILAGSAGPLREARRISASPPYGPPGTFTGFRIDSAAAQPIDHVLVSPGIGVESYAVVTQHWGGRLPSDHYPVAVRLVLPAR